MHSIRGEWRLFQAGRRRNPGDRRRERLREERDHVIHAGVDPQPPGKIAAGEACSLGHDLLKLSAEEMRQVRGAQISMIFQDPMTSLNRC